MAESDSDLDDMEIDKPVHSKKSKKQPQAWIEEDTENIVDFKDPSAASKITGKVYNILIFSFLLRSFFSDQTQSASTGRC